VVKSEAMAAWSAYVSNDGEAGTRNPVGRLMFDSMKANYILPASQHGFRKGRLCTTALATAHAAWVSANKSKVVAVIGLDLSATFDTVGREDLLPKMSAIDIGGKALKWFRCYLTNAKQHVVWEGHMPDIVDVEYGVWQGSLLGPVL
jgi:hypothetical protein